MPFTLIGTTFKTNIAPHYDSAEYIEAAYAPAGHPNHRLMDPYATIVKAKAAAEVHAGAPLTWAEQTLDDGLRWHAWRGKPHLCAWHGTTQYLITDGICWKGWADDPALVGHNAAMRAMGRAEVRGR
jgi:hypothetical protein